MFQKTRIRDFEKLIVFLNQLHKAFWDVYYNGQRPRLRPMSYSVRSLTAKKLKDLGDSLNHEHIVAETRMCMSLITQAAKALPKASRRALRWGVILGQAHSNESSCKCVFRSWNHDGNRHQTATKSVGGRIACFASSR